MIFNRLLKKRYVTRDTTNDTLYGLIGRMLAANEILSVIVLSLLFLTITELIVIAFLMDYSVMVMASWGLRFILIVYFMVIYPTILSCGILEIRENVQIYSCLSRRLW